MISKKRVAPSTILEKAKTDEQEVICPKSGIPSDIDTSSNYRT